MGLGKTVLAIMMIKLAQPQPGFCLVVAPKTVGVQWEDECNRTFKRVCMTRIEHVDYQLTLGRKRRCVS